MELSWWGPCQHAQSHGDFDSPVLFKKNKRKKKAKSEKM